MRIPLFIVICFNLAGCSFYQIDSHESNTNYFPPKVSSHQVRYIEVVNQPFEEIGTVTVTTERRQSIEEIMGKMKSEAAVLGGDALTDLRTDATGVWKKLKLQRLLGNAYIHANYTAKVLVLKKEEPNPHNK